MEYLTITDLGLGHLTWDEVSPWCSLDSLKRHLIVEHEVDDELIQEYAVASWNLVEVTIERSLKELFEQYDGIMPPTLIHAVRLLVGRYYAEREGESFTNRRDMSFSISALLMPYKGIPRVKPTAEDALKPAPQPEPEYDEEALNLSRWTGITAAELITKTDDELEKVAPFVLEVVATGEPIELKIEPTALEGYSPQCDGVVTLNGKALNEVTADEGDVLELVIPAGYHSVKDAFKGFTAKRLVLMSRAMLEHTSRFGGYNDLYTSITEVRDGAFSYAIAEWKFLFTFYGCTSLTSIPEGLFAGVAGSAASLFSNTFCGCTSLTSIPEGLFAGVAGSAESLFSNTFCGCTSLTSIPEGLFAGVAGSASFSFNNTFSGCTSLTSIPEGLFAGVAGSASFSFNNTFSGCTSLTSIPEGLFAGVTGNAWCEFWGTFYGCTSLTSIPEGLFAGVAGSAESLFSNTFYGCTSLTSIPEGLFAGVAGSAEAMFEGTFEECKNLQGRTPRIRGQRLWEACEGEYVGDFCFYGCIKLADYDEIPKDWKGEDYSEF